MRYQILSNIHILFILNYFIGQVFGHGRLVDPPARGTMWRLGFSTPPNYNDHELHCGGYAHQWEVNKGRCGECGDPWDLSRPRPNESGGTYGTGIISRAYKKGEETTLTVHLTANHLGWFEFRLCQNDKPKQYVKQKCLNKNVLELVDHPGTRYEVKETRSGLFRIRVKLPDDIICTNCVIQWHYTSGNNWGDCPLEADKVGCGPQEVFRGCSDIAIFSPDDERYQKYQNLTRVIDYSRMDDKTGHYKTEEESKKEDEEKRNQKQRNKIDKEKDEEDNSINYRKHRKEKQYTTTLRAKVYSYYNRYEEDIGKSLADSKAGNYVSSSSFRNNKRNKKIREFLQNLPANDLKIQNLQHLINKPRPQNDKTRKHEDSFDLSLEEDSSESSDAEGTVKKLSQIMSLLLKLTTSTSSHSDAQDLLDKVGKSLALAVKRKNAHKSQPPSLQKSISRVKSLKRDRKKYYSSHAPYRRKEKLTSTKAPRRIPIYVTPKTFVELLARQRVTSSYPSSSPRNPKSSLVKKAESISTNRNKSRPNDSSERREDSDRSDNLDRISESDELNDSNINRDHSRSSSGNGHSNVRNYSTRRYNPIRRPDPSRRNDDKRKNYSNRRTKVESSSRRRQEPYSRNRNSEEVFDDDSLENLLQILGRREDLLLRRRD